MIVFLVQNVALHLSYVGLIVSNLAWYLSCVYVQNLSLYLFMNVPYVQNVALYLSYIGLFVPNFAWYWVYFMCTEFAIVLVHERVLCTECCVVHVIYRLVCTGFGVVLVIF